MHENNCPKGCKIIHPPKKPLDFENLAPFDAETGWINQEKIKKYAFPPANDTRVFVCGLPSVYDAICGSSQEKDLKEGSYLFNLNYDSNMVVKF